MPLLISGGPALRVVPRGYDHAGYAQGVRQVRHTCVIADQESGAAQEGRQAAKIGASGQVHDAIRKLRGDRGSQAGFGGRAGQRDWQPASGKPTCHLDEIPERPAAPGCLPRHARRRTVQAATGRLGDVLEWPVIFRPERKFQVGASRGNTQEFDQAQQAIDLEPMIGVEQETLRIGAVPTGLQKPGGDPRPSRTASGLAILPYVWGGRDLRGRPTLGFG